MLGAARAAVAGTSLRPDEPDCARELMQLFSIGLVEAEPLTGIGGTRCRRADPDLTAVTSSRASALRVHVAGGGTAVDGHDLHFCTTYAVQAESPLAVAASLTRC